MSVANEQWNVCRFVTVSGFIAGSILCLVSLLVLTAISVDRLKLVVGVADPVVGAEIQTSCNFEANLRDRYYLLGCVHCRFSNVLLEFPYTLHRWHHKCIPVCSNFHIFLHKDFSHSASSSKSST